MPTIQTRAVRSFLTNVRDNGVVVREQSIGFKAKCFGSLTRASRAVRAWECGDVDETTLLLTEMFAYFNTEFPDPASVKECQAILAPTPVGRLVVDEIAFPVLITKYLLRTIRLDLSRVPSFAPWAKRHEVAILSA